MTTFLYHFTAFILAIHLVLVSAQTTAGEEYRLPNIYDALSYNIDISVSPEAFSEGYNSYSGQVEVQFSVKNSTNYIALNAHHNYVIINRITLNNTEVSSEDYGIDNITDILRINTSSTIGAGETCILTIDYTGTLSTTDNYGFYKSSYVNENGETKFLLTTFFSPVHARKAFPCFDEPALKGTFDFSFTFPVGFKVFFNTAQNSSSTNSTSGLTTVVFNTTPKMSTFILAFIITDFTCTLGASVGSVQYQVCSRNASAGIRELALEYAPLLLASLDNYTGYSYGQVMDKLDQVAIPDFAANAMENWGLITYRETALLWDRNESSNYYKQRVITVMAHELAHQWFGNLVTLYWWSAIFLKEGFATYFQYHTPHEILPEWQLDKQFVIDYVHPALLSDALENAHALQSDCYTPAEITARFSTISYSKGGSVLRMVQHFMGSNYFRSGLQNYITNNQFGYVEPEDIWAALSPSVLDSVSFLPADFNTVMENWIKLPGYPVLTVSLSGTQVTITQERFLFSGTDSTSQWYVPISYSISLDQSKFERTSPIVWLIPNNNVTFTLPTIAEWIILNNQQTGYYRVNYDATLWTRIATGLLRDNFDGITEVNRAQIVGDLFNLARADYFKYSRVLDTVTFLSNDVSYYPWSAAYTGFDFLLMRLGEDSLLGQAISATILELMSRLYDSVPISVLNEEDQIYTLKQVLANSWACKLGNENCVQQIQTLFNQFKSQGIRPNKNLRNIVYCNALRYGNDSSDWDFLWQVYSSSSDLATEQVTILSSLGCTRDEGILRRYLNMSITEGSGIRTQDALSVFSSVYTSSPIGVDVAFEFLMENYAVIAERYNSMNSLGNLIRGIAGRFTTESQVTKLREFIATGNLPEAFQVSANEALETAQTNLKWLENFQEDLFNYYDNSATCGTTASIKVVAFSVILVLVKKM